MPSREGAHAANGLAEVGVREIKTIGGEGDPVPVLTEAGQEDGGTRSAVGMDFQECSELCFEFQNPR